MHNTGDEHRDFRRHAVNAMPADGNIPATRVPLPSGIGLPPPGTDFVGMWYVARARHGIGDNNWFGFARRAADGREYVEWVTVPHRHADGIGAMTRLLEACGYTGGVMPACRDTAPPSLRALREARRAHPRMPVPRTPPRWRFLDATRATLPHDSPPAVLFLDDADRAALDAAARRAGVSTTTWLLWAGDRAARATLAEPGSTLPWVFPVNLRGAVHAADPAMNHCSGLDVVIGAETTAAEVADQVRARLAALEHWRSWRLLTLGRLVGQPGVNLLYRLARGRPGSRAGSYSNLGRWPQPGTHIPADPAGGPVTGVTCLAPGSPAYPVSLGMADWQGRQSLCCRVHPVASADPEAAARDLLAAWRSRATGG